MKNIDFLPNRYHQRGAARRAWIWRLLVLLLFGGVCTATAIGQYALSHSVAKQLAEVRPRHAEARATSNLFDQLQAQLRQLRGSAELYTYLRHPWPRTQLLAAVVQPLPESAALTQIDIHNEREAARARNGRRPPARAAGDLKQPPTQTLPARRDLQQLRQRFDNLKTVIHLTGRTTDPAAVHQYVAQLAGTPLFSRAELVSLESLSAPQQAASKFELRLVVRPGYGQRNGPPSEHERVDAARSGNGALPR